MKIDGVFSGGGVKAFVFIGALQALEEKNITIGKVAGTSAGALFATLVAAGYQSKELKEIFLNVNIDQFLDQSQISSAIPFLKWLTLYKTMGLYRGKYFENWLQSCLEKKGVKYFSDMNADQLKIVAADITFNRVVVFPDDLMRFYHIDASYFPIAKAVRSSISIPYFFRPCQITNPFSGQKSLIVDGMILSSFPLWLFEERSDADYRPVLGMQLTDPNQYYYNKKIKNAIDLLKATIGTMRKAHDTRYISKQTAEQILFFPVEEISSTDFSINRKEKESLIIYGYQRTKHFLGEWKYI
ncbi:patatin-like phospholipase family protein [Gracilibacillus sp. YIM 98692]|uniref:patatin-like phospholipase family protein n=1 Tax=Gracilibacillus sp. YIM 98692 TaxID=2663532 RepID=UPI0013D19AE9|nr:patatin-like phospholipase family protein [Gracilibacillus sp. YIM 98692]